jgi:hypothetical protein
LNPSSVEWRFGALGLLTGAVVLPLIGLLIGIMAAVFSANRMMYGLFATLGFVGTVVLVAALLLFALDAIQLRGQMPRRMIRRFDVTVVKAILMQIVQLIALGSVLWAGRRAMRAMPQPEREIGAGLVRG